VETFPTMRFLRMYACLFIIPLFWVNALLAQTISEKVKVNQIGYLPSEEKLAYVSDENASAISSWALVDAGSGNRVYESSEVGQQIDDLASGELVYKLNFSDFVTPGSYHLEVDGIGRSYEFEISAMVYNDVFDIIMKGFYYQRSGIELTSQYAGKWAKPAEYANDAYVYLGFDGSKIIKGEKINAAGGWRDAGDPNKKVVPASVTVHQLLILYEYFPTYISESHTNIPADAQFPDLPDYLTEIKVSLDWLVNMQRSDGAVWHAVGQEDFYLEGMGHLDPNDRYLMPVSTTATANFAAVMATAYRVFKDIEQDYAMDCLQASERAWQALNDSEIWSNPTIIGHNGSLQYPEENGYSGDPPGINNTAVYEDNDDADERHWASAELAISTDKQEYHDYFRAGIGNGIWYPSLWPAVSNLGRFSYAMAFRNESSATMNQLRSSISAYMDVYLGRMETTGFGTSLSAADYFWGSNNLAGQFSYTFLLSYEILGDERYKDAALSMLNYILGANSLNQSFVSGVGDKPVENIFHLPSFHDGISEVVPGLIPGGPNQFVTATDVVHANLINLESPPPAKCYVDSEFSFASNEAVILESAVWAFVTGYFYYKEIDNDNDGFATEDDCDDNNAQVNPSQAEVPYNGIDDDCNEATLDDDLDMDGYGIDQDCDDNNSAINPGEQEVPYNSIDEDCDPATLDDDLDEDGFGISDDCDDNNASVNPGLSEVPYNMLDDDCDASTLDDDLDEDGFGNDVDCDDGNAAINPEAEEIPNNDIDEDCDGVDLTSGLFDTADGQISIQPNPVLDFLFIESSDEVRGFEIYGLDGQLKIAGRAVNKQIEVSGLAASMYVLRVEIGQRRVMYKFVKM